MISLARISRLERLLDDLATPEPEYLSLLCWCVLGGRPEDIEALEPENREAAERLLTAAQEPDPLEERIAAVGRLPCGLKELPAGEPRQYAAAESVPSRDYPTPLVACAGDMRNTDR
jgi:hypothetical protein